MVMMSKQLADPIKVVGTHTQLPVHDRIQKMTDHEIAKLRKKLTPRTNRFIITEPTAKQTIFLLLQDTLEVMYGGAAGGGKSEALLTAAAQYVDVPGYAALILRRSYRDLALPGALMDRAMTWWRNTEAHWDGTNYRWTFPSGAKIQFGYLEHEGDETRYQSAEFQRILFDELTQFSQAQYTYMFSRIRRLRGSEIPVGMRSASNPGGVGHLWVKKRWGLPDGRTHSNNRIFVPARLEDNPHLDQDTYELSFLELSEVTRAQLRYGDWTAQNLGGQFDPAWFTIIKSSEVPDKQFHTGQVRHWDLGSSEPTEIDPNPDYTAGCHLLKANKMPEKIRKRLVEDIRAGAQIDMPTPPFWYILNMKRAQTHSGGVEEMLRMTAHLDGKSVPISIEQERGATGKLLIENYRRNILSGFQVHRLWTSGDKETRAGLVGGQASQGRYFVVEGDWTGAFLDEASLFKTKDIHDDQIDGLSGAQIQINKMLAIEEVSSGRVVQH